MSDFKELNKHKKSDMTETNKQPTLEARIAAAVLDHCYGSTSVTDGMIKQTTEVIRAVIEAPPPDNGLVITPNTLGGFSGAFHAKHRCAPTRQEIFDAGVRSGLARNPAAKFPPSVARDKVDVAGLSNAHRVVVQEAIDELRYQDEQCRRGDPMGLRETPGRLVRLLDKLGLLAQPSQEHSVRTPSSRWRAEAQSDPHGTDYDCERSALTMGGLTDDELANAVFMHGDSNPRLEDVLKGKAFMPIAYLTAAKERIRWLSRALERALTQSNPSTKD